MDKNADTSHGYVTFMMFGSVVAVILSYFIEILIDFCKKKQEKGRAISRFFFHVLSLMLHILALPTGLAFVAWSFVIVSLMAVLRVIIGSVHFVDFLPLKTIIFIFLLYCLGEYLLGISDFVLGLNFLMKRD